MQIQVVEEVEKKCQMKETTFVATVTSEGAKEMEVYHCAPYALAAAHSQAFWSGAYGQIPVFISRTHTTSLRNIVMQNLVSAFF